MLHGPKPGTSALARSASVKSWCHGTSQFVSEDLSKYRARTGHGSHCRCGRTCASSLRERANLATAGKARRPRRPAPETGPSVKSNSRRSSASRTPATTANPCCSTSWFIDSSPFAPMTSAIHDSSHKNLRPIPSEHRSGGQRCGCSQTVAALHRKHTNRKSASICVHLR